MYSLLSQRLSVLSERHLETDYPADKMNITKLCLQPAQRWESSICQLSFIYLYSSSYGFLLLHWHCNFYFTLSFALLHRLFSAPNVLFIHSSPLMESFLCLPDSISIEFEFIIVQPVRKSYVASVFLRFILNCHNTLFLFVLPAKNAAFLLTFDFGQFHSFLLQIHILMSSLLAFALAFSLFFSFLICLHVTNLLLHVEMFQEDLTVSHSLCAMCLTWKSIFCGHIEQS